MFEANFCNSELKPSLGSNEMPHKCLGPIGSTVLTFIGYKQTGRQTSEVYIDLLIFMFESWSLELELDLGLQIRFCKNCHFNFKWKLWTFYWKIFISQKYVNIFQEKLRFLDHLYFFVVVLWCSCKLLMPFFHNLKI